MKQENLMSEHCFMEASPFNRHLFTFMLENQDCFLQGKGERTMEVVAEAYRICGGILGSKSPATQIRSYIKYVEDSYQEMSSPILAIIWSALSVLKKQTFKTVTNILNSKLGTIKWFSLWKHFVSAYLQKYGYTEIPFPMDSKIMVFEAKSGEEAMSQALQSAKASHDNASGNLQQTLVFPHVEQFNNNPAKVINYNQKK